MNRKRQQTTVAPNSSPKFGEPEFFYDLPQRSDDWFELRRGIPTASEFSSVMAEGRDGDESRSRAKYMQMLAGEIISEQVSETFRSEAMRRGQAMEPIAREWYARRRFDEVVQVGFVRRRLPSGRYIGCSPDAQVGGRSSRKGLEIKSVTHDEMVRLANAPAGGFPPRFKWQLHGTILVAGWVEMDLLVYAEGMGGLEFKVERDEHKAKQLGDALEVFDYDVNELVKMTKGRLTK